MPPPELDDADSAALVELLRQTIAADRYPLSPRIRKLRAVLAKLVPPRPEPLPRPGRSCCRAALAIPPMILSGADEVIERGTGQ